MKSAVIATIAGALTGALIVSQLFIVFHLSRIDDSLQRLPADIARNLRVSK